jgi:hypothetical protein
VTPYRSEGLCQRPGPAPLESNVYG